MTAPPIAESNGARSWACFASAFGIAGVALTVALYIFILAMDPYGLRASPAHPPGPIMDLNQRFMYPQIIRGGAYDSAAFGTSTIRLLDPRRLSELFHARFANLGLNAGTPWEQVQVIDLFLRHVPVPKAMILGLDPTWCEADADRKRLTARSFPPWLYDEDPLDDLPELLNLKSLEIGGRVALQRLVLMRSRMREDGYERFVPPESAYDLARARSHIAAYERATRAAGGRNASAAADRESFVMPALAWLEGVLARLPASTQTILAFMPLHAAAQPAPDTAAFAWDEECKARIARIGARHGATVVDFRRRSPVTTDDSNYWDPLHYRTGIAERLAESLWEAHTQGREAADGFDRILARRRELKLGVGGQ
jgi:hypothetical protein